ncbi:MAG: GDP-mannose dehydrogenase [Pirellula sp.]|nr:GDP-mannose dehydrogenase [Pirellula sp.]
MRISVFGLGYVGCVTSGCLARDGHTVYAVDIQKSKVERIASGLPTVVENGLDPLIATGVAEGRIIACSDAETAVHNSDVSIICVGTPNANDGSLDLSAIQSTCRSLGLALRRKSGRHIVINRSTVPPGTAADVVLPLLVEASNKPENEIGVLVVPEFLREGCAIADYDDPPFVIVGSIDEDYSVDAPHIEEMFSRFRDRIRWLPSREAEMLKGLCNVFHAMKVSFANEIGSLCSAISVDGRRVMHELVQDTKLNISPAYLRPGLPFGGSCLPKDLRMMISMAQSENVDLPLLRGILASNDAHLQRAMKAITASGRRRIGIDGLSFKAGTDDLRESPIVLMAEYLIGKGFDVLIYDPDVQVSFLSGANQKYVQDRLPHLSCRMAKSPEDLLEHSELVVFTRDKSTIRTIVANSISPIDSLDLNSLSAVYDAVHPKHDIGATSPVLAAG